jgi:hypothetical protein
MAEAKKPRAKSVQKTDLVEMAAAAAVETVEATVIAEPASQPKKASQAKPVETAAIFSTVREQGDVLRHALREAVTVSAQGVLEVNGKIIDALQAQSHAAIDLWQNAIRTPHLSDALSTQTSATRQAYETASAQWKDIAETTAHWFTRSFEPLQTVLQRQGR